MMTLSPGDHREVIALFRYHLLADLLFRPLSRGELKAELQRISTTPVRAPDADATRTVSVATLERWLRAWRQGGLAALKPAERADRGRARALNADAKALVLDIRRAYPTASAEVILRSLVEEGRLAPKLLTATTLRRLFAEHDLHRVARGRVGGERRQRLPWQMPDANMLWHGDVCHGIALGTGRKTALRIHGLLDDASRYLIALEAHSSEKEVDLLGLLVDALRREGRPDGLYLDNGSTYRGDTLAVACARLSIGLRHARPYDPQARGKMERFWKTLRSQCLDFITPEHTLADVNQVLQTFRERYHDTAHAGLADGKTPREVYAARQRADIRLTEAQLESALTVVEKRRVRNDSTLSVGGRLLELVDAAFLAGHVVTVKRCLVPGLPGAESAWVEHEGRRLTLRPVDSVRNAHRKRHGLPVTVDVGATTVDWNPIPGKTRTTGPGGAP